VTDSDSSDKIKIKTNQNITNSGDNNGTNNSLCDIDMSENCPENEETNSSENNNETSVTTKMFKQHHQEGSSSGENDDEEETFETVHENLPQDLKPLKEAMYKAQGCCLLLILKHYLKEVYSIADS
jgi:hypothetical protein